jgi:hypothetical protein
MDTYPNEVAERKSRRTSGCGIATPNKTSRLMIHSLSYTFCQSVFYIMCFQGKEAIGYYRKAVQYYSEFDEDNMEDDQQLLYIEPKFID